MSLYVNRGLETPVWLAFVKTLAREVWEKGRGCSVCENENVDIAIFDYTPIKEGFLVFARLLCKEHKERWQNYVRLSYSVMNGVMHLQLPHTVQLNFAVMQLILPHAKSIKIVTRMPWNDLEEFMTTHTEYDVQLVRDLFNKQFEQTWNLAFEGTVQEFLNHVCPKCRSPSNRITGSDATTITYKCQECKHVWNQSKKEPYNIIEPKDEPRDEPKNTGQEEMQNKKEEPDEKSKKKRWLLR